MSAPADTAKSPSEAAPESPTTARPFEMDDDDVQESGILGDDGVSQPKPSTAATPTADTAPAATTGAAPTTSTSTSATSPTAAEVHGGESEVPPPKPPRPVTEEQKNELILKEAFPAIEPPVIKAVLRASRGNIDQSFNALLEMTDPDAAQHETEQEQPPPPPPRPATSPSANPQSQLEADEIYARQLAEHYRSVGEYEARTANRGSGGGGRRQQTGLSPDEMYDREHSFIDDDLPVIRDNLRKGFLETQTKVNSWFTNLKKRIDDQFDEEDGEGGTHHGDPHHSQQAGGSSFSGRPSRDPQSRRSADYDRYDADPELLSDDFAGMKFRSDGTPAQGHQPYANPNRFQPPPPPKSPRSGERRKVAFSETVDDIDAYDASPKLPPGDSGASGAATANNNKASKWQPLSMVDPSPIAENDPFSLGDSEDEKDAKDRHGSREIKMEDSERLKKAAAEAMADSLVDEKEKDAGAAGKKE